MSGVMEKAPKYRVPQDVIDKESAALRALWRATKHPKQAEFGELYEIGNQSAVGQFLNGKTPLSKKAARGFARGLNCKIADFSPRLAAEIDGLADVNGGDGDEGEFADIPHLSVHAGAGPGQENAVEEVVGSLKFRRAFLREVGVSPEHGAIINVRGASMEPLIKHGAVLLVNRANREARAGQVYVFLRQGELIVKKAAKNAAGEWIARSENDDRETYPDFPFKDGDLLIGRAVWMGVKL